MSRVQIGEFRGGWRASPNSLAALDRYRTSWTYRRKCGAGRCKQVALKNSPFCVWHTPGAKAAGFGRGERRQLVRMEQCGLLPLELMALPVWRDLGVVKTSRRTPMRLALVKAWDRRLTSPLAWVAAQRAARELAASPGDRAPHGSEAWY